MAPKDLPSCVPPVLTRNSTGTVVVYLGQTKAVPPVKYVFYHRSSRSTLLFNPLSGEETLDVSLVTLALSRIKDANQASFTPSIYRGKISDGRPPDEIIIICLDQSGSMKVRADFQDSQSVGNWNQLSRVILNSALLTPSSKSSRRSLRYS